MSNKEEDKLISYIESILPSQVLEFVDISEGVIITKKRSRDKANWLEGSKKI